MSPLYCAPALGKLIKPVLGRLLAPRPLDIRIDIYNTYSHPNGIFVRGRALEKKPTDVPLTIADSWWTNLQRTWHALESDEVTDLELWVQFEGQKQSVTTDNEGLFSTTFVPDNTLNPGVYSVEVGLRTPSIHRAATVQGQVFVHPLQSPSWGVVSDIDDTILESHVTQRLKMFKKLLFGNGLTAIPVSGMSEIYQKLHQRGYTFHYLSGSPINLHQRLRAFLDHQGFPEGSMDLRHWGIGPDTDAILSSSTYKLQRLQKFFQRFPERRFVLIGDSGEKDPEIYSAIRKAFPHQVLGIAIHRIHRLETPSSTPSQRFKDMFLFEEAEELDAFIAQLPTPQKSDHPSDRANFTV